MFSEMNSIEYFAHIDRPFESSTKGKAKLTDKGIEWVQRDKDSAPHASY